MHGAAIPPELILSRRDVDFLVFEWLSAADLVQRRHYSSHDRPEFEAVLDIYQLLASDLFAPHNKKNDMMEPQFDGERVSIIPEVGSAVKAFAEAGLLAAGLPEEWGGLGLPSVIERAGLAFTLAANGATAGYAMLTIANANLLVTYGASGPTSRYIRPLCRGRYLGTMCLSESSAGSNLADITTRAVRQPDGMFRVYGNKMWISGGDHEIAENIVHLVLAKIPDDHGKLPIGTEGISLFVVPRSLVGGDSTTGERNDVVVAGINHKMGYRGTVNCMLNFGEGRFRPGGSAGAIGELVGEAGRGLLYMFHMMNESRINVGLGAAALAYTGYLHSLEYARSRRQGRLRGAYDQAAAQVPIVRHADVRRMLLAQKAYAAGGLALCLYAARLSDDTKSIEDEDGRKAAKLLLELLTPVAKSWSSQWGTAANDLAIQVHGGYGYTRDFNVEQFYRDNRLNSIHEGTFGIHALDLLGRKVPMNGGEGLSLLGRRLEATVKNAYASDLPRHAAALSEAWARILDVTDKLGRIGDLDVRLANAAAYLEAFGHVVVAWLWLDQAVVAQIALRSADGVSADFYRGKRAACDFFFGWELPKVQGWLTVLDPLERTPVDTPDASL